MYVSAFGAPALSYASIFSGIRGVSMFAVDGLLDKRGDSWRLSRAPYWDTWTCSSLLESKFVQWISDTWYGPFLPIPASDAPVSSSGTMSMVSVRFVSVRGTYLLRGENRGFRLGRDGWHRVLRSSVTIELFKGRSWVMISDHVLAMSSVCPLRNGGLGASDFR